MAVKELKDKTITVRATESSKELLEKLCKMTEQSQADVIALALENLYGCIKTGVS